jgi:hypothetical protein
MMIVIVCLVVNMLDYCVRVTRENNGMCGWKQWKAMVVYVEVNEGVHYNVNMSLAE